MRNKCESKKEVKMYKELKGKCKEYIDKELCLGCNRLELQEFKGLKNCKYAEKESWKQEEIWKTK